MAITTRNRLAGADEVHSADAIEVYVAEEATPGVLPVAASQYWREVEANSFSTHGIVVETAARSFFNPNRTEGRAKIQKETAEAGWQSDVTDDQFPLFARGFLFSDNGITANMPFGAKPDTQSIYTAAPINIGAITTTSIALANAPRDAGDKSVCRW